MSLRQAVEELLLGVDWQALLDGAAAGGTGGAGSVARLAALQIWVWISQSVSQR